MLNTAFHNRGRPGGQTIASPQLLLGSSFLNVMLVNEADELDFCESDDTVQAKYRWGPLQMLKDTI